ncbi:hypothetical protein AwErysi_00250 [Erysipelotrichaceae bacterium]|nr:hypothetical protein AwErysi_00250 [Erysipelotrichaceae bacterium]
MQQIFREGTIEILLQMAILYFIGYAILLNWYPQELKKKQLEKLLSLATKMEEKIGLKTVIGGREYQMGSFVFACICYILLKIFF